MKLGLVQSIADSCLLKHPKNENTLYMIVYVDDLLIAVQDRHMNNII